MAPVIRKVGQAVMKTTPPDEVIRIEIDGVSKRRDNAKFSAEAEVKGVKWEAVAWLKDGIDFTGVTLSCEIDQTAIWNIDANAEFILVQSDTRENLVVKESHNFGNENLELWVPMIRRKELFENKKGYIKDDKITVEIHIWLSNMKGIRNARQVDFTDSNVPYHDVTLIIEGKKIYASKQILASHSSEFEKMFYGNSADKNKNEFELKDVNREEFIELLHVIYPSNKEIKRGSVVYLLELGDRFKIARVMERVEKFFIDLPSIFRLDQLKTADQYKLFWLQEHTISQIKTRKEFNYLKRFYDDFSDDMKAAIHEHESNIFGSNSDSD